MQHTTVHVILWLLCPFSLSIHYHNNYVFGRRLFQKYETTKQNYKKKTIVHINYLNNFLNKHPEMQTVEPGTKPIKFNPVDPSLNLTPWIPALWFKEVELSTTYPPEHTFTDASFRT